MRIFVSLLNWAPASDLVLHKLEHALVVSGPLLIAVVPRAGVTLSIQHADFFHDHRALHQDTTSSEMEHVYT